MTAERVAAAGAAWLWWPSDATVVRDERLVLVRWPDHYRVAPTVVRVAADAPVAATLEAAVDRAREWGSTELLVWVKPDAPAGLEAALRTRGGVHDDTVDVFALDLAGGVPDLAVPADVEVRWQLDEATTRDVLQVGIEAFEDFDMDALVALLHEDATMSMPPFDLWLRGAEAIRQWNLGTGSGCRGSRLVPIMANGMPAFAQYRSSGPNGEFEPWALQLLDISDGRIVAINSFLDTERMFPLFGVAATLPA